MPLSFLFWKPAAAPARADRIQAEAPGLADMLIALRWQGPPEGAARFPHANPCAYARIRIDLAAPTAHAPAEGEGPPRRGYEVLALDCGADPLGFTAADVVRDRPLDGSGLAGLWISDPAEATPRGLRLVAGRRGESFTDILVLGESDAGREGAGAAMERHHDDGRLEALSGLCVIEALRPVRLA